MPELPAGLKRIDFSINNSIEQHKLFFRNAYRRIMVAWYLIRDPRVELIHKLIPVAALIYVISPLDFLPEVVLGPIGGVEDVFILMFAVDWFVQLVPPQVVYEIATKLGYGDSEEEPAQLEARSGDPF